MVELIALQSILRAVVIKTVVVSTVLVVALHNDAAYSLTGGHPDVVVLVFGNTTDVIIT